MLITLPIQHYALALDTTETANLIAQPSATLSPSPIPTTNPVLDTDPGPVRAPSAAVIVPSATAIPSPAPIAEASPALSPSPIPQGSPDENFKANTPAGLETTLDATDATDTTTESAEGTDDEESLEHGFTDELLSKAKIDVTDMDDFEKHVLVLRTMSLPLETLVSKYPGIPKKNLYFLKKSMSED